MICLLNVFYLKTYILCVPLNKESDFPLGKRKWRFKALPELTLSKKIILK